MCSLIGAGDLKDLKESHAKFSSSKKRIILEVSKRLQCSVEEAGFNLEDVQFDFKSVSLKPCLYFDAEGRDVTY